MEIRSGCGKRSCAKPRIAVHAVLFDDDNHIALSYRRKQDLHTLPGGSAEPGEDLHTALQRKVWEKTGCRCEITEALGRMVENRCGEDFTQERCYYIARVVGGKGAPPLTDEAIAEDTTVVWVPPEQALRIISEKPPDHYRRKFLQRRDVSALTEALIWRMLHDIPGYDSFTKREPICKGWSGDRKYYAETAGHKQYLIRTADISQYEQKRAEFENMKRAAALGIPMQQPVDFGTCNDGRSVFLMLTWIAGDDAEDLLPQLSDTQQYLLGRKAGEILKEMQTIETFPPSDDWFCRYNVKIDRYIRNYRNCGLTFDGADQVIAYIEQNRHLLKNRPMCLTHDDFHPGNLILNQAQELFVIDFQRFRVAEPYHAFAGVQFSARSCPYFAIGQINAYFNGDPPEDFWQLLALYMACTAVNALPWSIPYGREEIDFAYRQIAQILSWYDNFKRAVPAWYRKDFYIQYLDGVPFRLKSPFDFSFLGKYGKVFKVFDEQDGGNLCFGTEQDDKRYFIKFAGAPTAGYNGKPEDAIARLRASVPIYRDLGAYPGLIRFIGAGEIGGGYATMFAWTDAVGIGRMYPQNHRRFMALPVEKRSKVFEDILFFHEFVCGRGYVAIDFYDGSILYDFENEKTVICDIDFYQKIPYYGEMGLWGSSRFVSPEECRQGERMDERTTVYTMGATAFALLSDSDRSPEAWPLSEARYAVVSKAVRDEKNARQQSIRQLTEEWMEEDSDDR